MRIEHDIFDLIGGGSRYHSAIITCYSFDPVFFSNFYLPSLRSAGPRNILVLVDSANYDSALDGFERYGNVVPEMKCHLVRMRPSSNGVFHPKLVLLFGKKDVFIAVGSGNLTYSGYLRNDELWGAFQISGETSSNYPILRQAWDYLLGLLPKEDAIDRQITWIRENCPCIETAEHNEEAFATINNHTRAYFIGNTGEGTIYSQISEIVGNRRVNYIKVLSPFYDQNECLNQLQGRYNPSRLSYVFDSYSPLLPRQMRDNWHAFEWINSNKRLHGKAFQFETDDNTVLVIGSANSTVAAWGNDESYSNDEACIVLVSDEKKDYFEELEIGFDKEVNSLKPGSAGYPEKESKSGFEYHILSCVCNAEGVFFISLDKDVPECDLIILNRLGQSIRKEKVESSNCLIKIKIEYDLTGRIVALSNDGKWVTNKCLILSEYQLQGMNPDDSNRKLDLLLESSPDWEGHIEEILSYAGYHSVKWDELRQASSSRRKTASEKQKEEKADPGIKRADFDRVVLGGSLPPHVAANLKIADYLNARLKGSSLDEDDSEVDAFYSQKDKDGGLPDEDPKRNKTIEHKVREVKVYKSLMSFCLRVNKSYDLAIAKKGRLSSGLPASFAIEPTLDDYSIFATVVICAFYCQLHKEKAFKFNWYTFVLSFVAKFLYIFRIGYKEGHGYSFNKLQELQRDAAVNILLLFSHFYWERKDALVEIVVLNLLDSIPDKEKVIEQYKKSLDEKALDYRSDSVRKIDLIIRKHHLLIDTTIPTKNVSDGQLSKRKSIGYSYVQNLKRDRTGINAYDCIHPAFLNKPLVIRCGDLLPISYIKDSLDQEDQ
ncbi:MAG: hypothetical protein IKM75_09170 [Bacteroidales bacterium]|nr:hypothetical protein [Bacteroidales bacterium]MBR6865018.1 hypothetical protein [Bacteroidales bacterium]